MYNLIKSLDYSKKYLPDEPKKNYPKQIKAIKQLLKGKWSYLNHIQKDINLTYSKLSKHFNIVLDWEQINDEYFVQVNSKKAIIKEEPNRNLWIIGRVANYYLRIEDEQGKVINRWECTNFADAEHWVKAKSYEEKSALTEDELRETLQQTLDACLEALPEKANPIHYLRLEWIKGRIDEILL